MKNLIFLILFPVFFFCGAAEKLPLPSGKAELKQTETSAPVRNFIPENFLRAVCFREVLFP